MVPNRELVITLPNPDSKSLEMTKLYEVWRTSWEHNGHLSFIVIMLKLSNNVFLFFFHRGNDILLDSYLIPQYISVHVMAACGRFCH